MVQTVIFDMDGVIVDTEPLHRFAYEQHFKQLNIDVSDALYASFTGNSTRNIYQKLKNQFGLTQEVEDLVKRKRSLFNDAFDAYPQLSLIDGVEILIEDLLQNDTELILASSSAKETIERVFKRFNLNKRFKAKVSGEDFPLSKPHPAIFQHAASLAKNPNQCIVIEDSTNGILAAKAAGIFCVGYDSPNSKLQDYTQADLIIAHFNELNATRVKNLID